MQKNKRWLFFILLILSPGLWWPLLNIKGIFSELRNIPLYGQNKINTIFGEERIRNVGAMRWANRDLEKEQVIYSKLFYNKVSILVDEFFSFLSLFSPRYYFQSGDGSGFSPSNVEPVPILLFPFWLIGLLMLVTKKQNKVVLLYIVTAFVIFMTGKMELPYVWPILIFNVYFGYFALKNMKYSSKALTIAVIIIYALYINFRLIVL